MLLFLAFGAHRWVFKALAESFNLIPLAGFTPGENLFALMLTLFERDFLDLRLKLQRL